MQHECHRFKVFEAHPNGGDSVSLREGSWRWGSGSRQQEIKCATVWSNIDSKRVRVSITGICHFIPSFDSTFCAHHCVCDRPHRGWAHLFQRLVLSWVPNVLSVESSL